MKPIAIVTGSNGLVGSEACLFLFNKGFQVIGLDNGMRRYFFDVSQARSNFTEFETDIRSFSHLEAIFRQINERIEIVVHAAAQPSHDWAAKEPLTDFEVNALGTMNMLEVTRKYCPKATFIFTSTSKVYGDTPNDIECGYTETETRWNPIFADYEDGFNERLSIDQCLHSVFGASKVAADVMSQEYGKYFGMNVGVFRPGCITGKRHAGAELHGFLSYLVKCAVTKTPYKIYGYKGKQVRCNIHSYDLVSAFWEFHQNPRKGEVYNIGGGMENSCSILEAIDILDSMGYPMTTEYVETPRIGDHIYWVSDNSKFQSHYPNWKITKDLKSMIEEIVEESLKLFKK